jgi:hypothetical protein
MFFAIVVGSLLTNDALAQDDSDSHSSGGGGLGMLGGSTHVQLGIKAGINRGNIYDEHNPTFSANGKTGYVAGAFVSIPFGAFLGLQPEVLWSQKGFVASGTTDDGNPYTFTRTLNYIDVPIQLQVKPIKLITIVAGPNFAFLTKRSDSFKSSNITSSEIEEIKHDDVRNYTLGVQGGVDVHLLGLLVAGRVGWDLQNSNLHSTTLPNYKNAWVQGTVGFRF